MSGPGPQLVPGRTCGECTVCCAFFNIDEPDLQKPGGVLCRHAGAGGGCGVYASRPNSCRRFHCLWRLTERLPDSGRPDRLGVIFWTSGKPQPPTVFETVYLVGAAVKDPRALEQDAVRDLVETFSGEGALPIFLEWGGAQHLIHPAPPLADAILNPLTTPHQELVAQGRAWLARYAPIARAYAAQAGAQTPDF